MSKRRIFTVFITICLGFAVFAANSARAVNYLKDIKVQKAGDSIAVIVTTSQPCEYHPFLTSTKPERIVMDLTGVVNAWDNKKFRELPLKSIEAIRTSQFKSDPEPVARVVLDIGRPIDFRSFQNGSDIVVKLPALRDEADFADWSVKGVVPKTSRAESKPAVEEKPREKRKASGVEIESYPKRKLVAYGTSSYRDPFEPLVGGPGGQLGQGLPALENLALVGVLVDEDGYRALLEDAEGNGYILQPKDRVRNGYLVSVTDDKAIFQITEYGWTRTVALELDLTELK
ncbi:MAG: AMIN domain-containing protein [Candidatus Zixiibacteriota bacterium]|nr:MAG: AMIN domain-containing protein [candidate division Zixibacteria bacterium]